jgi:hypothetical protein
MKFEKSQDTFELMLSPHGQYWVQSHVPLTWYFCNRGPGIAHVECHNNSQGPTAQLHYVEAHGAVLSAAQVAVFSGAGPISLTSVDDEGATLLVEKAWRESN